MEDKTEYYDPWLLLKHLTENVDALDVLKQIGFRYKESVYTKNANIESCDIRWILISNYSEMGELELSIMTDGIVTMFFSRKDQDNLLYIDRLIEDIYPQYVDLLDLKNFPEDMDSCVRAYYSALNQFFSSKITPYFSGEKWIEMEVDWGDYK